MRIATSETNRPAPQNNARETSGWPSDLRDEAGVTEITVAMRAAFGMSALQMHSVKTAKNGINGNVCVVTAEVQ
jgi:hypothetical protein